MTLFVPDLVEALKFYADVFGLDAQSMDEGNAMLSSRASSCSCTRPRRRRRRGRTF